MEYEKEAQQLIDKSTGKGIYPIARASDLRNDDGTPYILPAQLKVSGTDTSTTILGFTSDKGIYVGTDTGHWYYWNGSSYKDGGVYQATEIADGSVVTSKLADESVTHSKTSFINNSINLFNKEFMADGCYCSQEDGSFGINSIWSCTKIYIDSQMGYLIDTITTPSNGARHYAFFDNNNTFISGGYAQQLFSIPENAVYVMISFDTTQVSKDTYQLQYGTTLTTYESYKPFTFKNFINKSPITPEDTTFISKTGKNIFNKNAVIYGYYIDQRTGKIIANSDYCYEYIVIDRTRNITNHLVDTPQAENQNRHYAYFDANGNYISGGYRQTINEIPNNAVKISISIATKSLNTYQLEYGMVATDYEPYIPRKLSPDIVVNTSESTSNTLEVGQGKPYSTITEALDDAQENDTILIYSGVYHEHLVTSLFVTIKGTSKDECIIEYSGKSYGTDVLKINKGVLENLTLHALREEQDGSPAYCLHIDSKNGSKDSSMFVRNCRFIQDMDGSKTVGLALANNFTLEFDDCEFVNNGNGSAFYCHSCETFGDTSYTDLTGQKLVVKNCSFINNSDVDTTIHIQSQELVGAEAECVWQRNIVINQGNGGLIRMQLWNDNNNLSKDNWLGSTDWTNSILSMMNNCSELNY